MCASWHEPRKTFDRVVYRVFVGSCVGLAALVGVLVVLAVIDWSGV